MTKAATCALHDPGKDGAPCGGKAVANWGIDGLPVCNECITKLDLAQLGWIESYAPICEQFEEFKFPLLSCVAIDMSGIQWVLTARELDQIERRRGLVVGHEGSRVKVLWDDGYRTLSEGHGLRRAKLTD